MDNILTKSWAMCDYKEFDGVDLAYKMGKDTAKMIDAIFYVLLEKCGYSREYVDDNLDRFEFCTSTEGFLSLSTTYHIYYSGKLLGGIEVIHTTASKENHYTYKVEIHCYINKLINGEYKWEEVFLEDLNETTGVQE